MKKVTMFLCFALCSFIHINAQPISGPNFGIPMSEIRSAIGIDEKGDFALVYKSDTLASYTSTNIGSVATFFDEEIQTIRYPDSVEYRYLLPDESGVKRFSLPDTLPLYSQFYSPLARASYLIRYDSEGKERFKKELQERSTIITETTDTYTSVTTIQDTRWMVKYTSVNSDSSHLKTFNNDSTLQQWSYVLTKTNGERLTETQINSPANYSYTKGFHTPDTNYSYRLNIDAKGDTIQHESFTQKFKDSDSTYFCGDWGGAEYVARTEQFQSPKKDSSYTVDSREGTQYTIHYLDDSLTVRKAFDLNGNLAYRSFMKEINGNYGMEEILEKRDTFYHVINYYHQLYWENEITDYFPFYKQIHIGEDSVILRILDYSFEKEGEWPVLTITEGDSSWVEKTDEGADSKYAAQVGFCGGTSPTLVGLKMSTSTYSFSGLASRKTEKELANFTERNYDGDIMGSDLPPLYFLKNKNSNYTSHNLSKANQQTKAEIQHILSGKGDKAKLYYQNNIFPFNGTFAKVYFSTHNFIESGDGLSRPTKARF